MQQIDSYSSSDIDYDPPYSGSIIESGWNKIKDYFYYLGVIFAQKNPPCLTFQKGECDVIASQHSIETELWREKLIMAAEHNIVISGNYCGGHAFIRLLNKIEERIQEKPNINVIILSSPDFLYGASYQRLNEILETYPNNISFVECPSIWHIIPGIKRSTNHTKCMVIDYGRYFILGGSGIADFFSDTGLNESTQEGIHHLDPSSFLESILPNNFRDQDWIFKSHAKEKSIGSQVYMQMLLLARKWEKITHSSNRMTSSLLSSFEHQTWGYSDDALFSQHSDRIGTGSCQLLFSTPEHEQSQFAKEALHQIETAKTSILINHMYFHPTNEVMDALIAAANRGVHIKIITCGVYPEAPACNLIFGPRNRYNYSYLFNSVAQESQSHISVYEFRGIKKGYHKKLIVIDEAKLLIGSSNFGYKSLVTASDDEINAVIESKTIAQATLDICKIDEEHSEKITDLTSPHRLIELFKVIQHRIFAPLIG